MRKYAFIKDGKVDSVIDGKDDNSRNWEEYYSETMGMKCIAIPENLSVSTGDFYVDGEFKGELEQWRSTASLSRRRFKIGEALYQVNGTPLVELIEALLAGLTEPQKTVATIAYNESGQFDRLDPFILQFSQALEMSEEETDTFFRYCQNEDWNNID